MAGVGGGPCTMTRTMTTTRGCLHKAVPAYSCGLKKSSFFSPPQFFFPQSSAFLCISRYFMTFADPGQIVSHPSPKKAALPSVVDLTLLLPHPAVGEARCDTMLPSIQILWFSLFPLSKFPRGVTLQRFQKETHFLLVYASQFCPELVASWHNRNYNHPSG